MVDYGHVLETGPEGAWDCQWAGVTPVGVIKKKGDSITVVFSEAVGQASVEKITNYSISRQIEIVDASLGVDFKTVTLKTSKHINEISYTLTFSNVLDRASTPNPITANTKLSYNESPCSKLQGISID